LILSSQVTPDEPVSPDTGAATLVRPKSAASPELAARIFKLKTFSPHLIADMPNR
jgi:hypothetical protein